MTTTYRPLHPGMGQAVAERTILREKENGTLENWGDVADRVALGNTLLLNNLKGLAENSLDDECTNLRDHIAQGRLLMSGRHLQHGDATQPTRNMEVFTNCSTACTSNLSFYLLLNGSGVGRSYDDSLMRVDLRNAPDVICVLSDEHPDFKPQYIIPEKVENLPDSQVFMVPDSREGWGQATEVWENLTHHNPDGVKTLILDFSEVRCEGSPIGGMQDRPASGPGPLMEAFDRAAMVSKLDYEPWKSNMYVDHYFAECVRVGGARRAARIAVKYWKDPGIFEFIKCKQEGDLWSANNSVGVDAEFWQSVGKSDHATAVLNALIDSGYGTGEPGIINLDRISKKPRGLEKLQMDKIGSDKFTPSKQSQIIMEEVFQIAIKTHNYHIVNPCGEISLALWGGFCVIADVVPYHCDTLDQAEDAYRAAVRALIRTNTMDSIYDQEVKRTNRIGVGMTGIHEFAWKFFKLGFKDLIDESKSQAFWDTIARFRDAVIEEAHDYAEFLGVEVPHTMLTIKPAGTTSKLFGLTEGWHLASMEFYLRWTQFKDTDPLVEKYKLAGYPTKELVKYEGTTIVGFPTETEIGRLKVGTSMKLVTAGEATPEEQYQWLRLGEKYWLGEEFGNQISYTLKYHPDDVSLADFREMLVKHQSEIKCCSVMPHGDDAEMVALYEYLPEERIDWEDFLAMKNGITEVLAEDLDKTHIDCEGGACPVDFNK